MLKHLTLLVVAGLVANTGCVITTTPTETDSASSNNPPQTSETDGTTDTTDGTAGTTDTTDGTTDTTDGTDGTATVPTTGVPTTTDDTTDGTTDDTTDGTTTEGGNFGQCGWDARNKYYACGLVGEDPDGISPIGCPDRLPAAGDPCDDTTPITGVGCCLPDGTNYYCSNEGMIVTEECGA